MATMTKREVVRRRSLSVHRPMPHGNFMHLTLTSADWVICIGALAFNILLGLYFALRARRRPTAAVSSSPAGR